MSDFDYGWLQRIRNGLRKPLTASRTYYVRTDGSDSNTGLANSSSGAFLTIQKAIDTVLSLDIGTNNVTIQLGDGTYTAGATISSPWVGSGTVTLLGNTSTPANVIISTTSANAITLGNGARLTISGLELRTTTAGSGIICGNFSTVTVGAAVRFGACADYHVYSGGYVLLSSAYTVSGGAICHWLTTDGGVLICSSITVTVSGTPAFSYAFAFAQNVSYIGTASVTWSGSATGTRYQVAANSVINTFGGGASYFPGSVAGATSTGGQYL